MPSVPRAQDRQGFSKEEEETLPVSAIVVLPFQRKQERVDGKGVEDWAIGITAMRCRGFTPSA